MQKSNLFREHTFRNYGNLKLNYFFINLRFYLIIFLPEDSAQSLSHFSSFFEDSKQCLTSVNRRLALKIELIPIRRRESRETGQDFKAILESTTHDDILHVVTSRRYRNFIYLIPNLLCILEFRLYFSYSYYSLVEQFNGYFWLIRVIYFLNKEKLTVNNAVEKSILI